jgi:catechol 2,3-dioxygenase-like lactoylglutathione lyase family enzyme
VLASPHHAVVATRDLDVMTSFLRTLGFGESARGELSADATRCLYGLGDTTPERLLVAGDAPGGLLRLVATPTPAPASGPYACGPMAIDLYTTDIERSLALAGQAGARCGPIGRYAAGPTPIAEARAVGPDGLAVVFIQIEPRRPSLLDRQPNRLHSEVHSIVWAVPDVDEAAAPWRAAGLQTLADLTLTDPVVGEFLELPRPDAPLRLQLLCDEAATPSRLEVLAFLEDGDAAVGGETATRAGLHAAGFIVDDLVAAAAALPGVVISDPVDTHGVLGPAHAVAGTAPGGVRFELWQLEQEGAHDAPPHLHRPRPLRRRRRR